MRTIRVLIFVVVLVPTLSSVVRAQDVDPFVCADQLFPDFCFMTSGVAPIHFGHMAWGDVDRDGDMELFAMGNRNTRVAPVPFQQFYRNDGDDVILSPPNTPNGPPSVEYITKRSAFFDLVRVSTDSLLWDGGYALADANGDGFLDVAVSGITSVGETRTDLYLNDANGTALVSHALSLPGLASSSLAWGDADNDGDLDLAVTGVSADGGARVMIAENDGSGLLAFNSVDLPGGAFGRVVWGDDDGDGDLDLLVSGVADDQKNIVRVYRNDGLGGFTDSVAPLRSLLFAAADWGDFDNDGDLDILVAGGQLDPFVARGLVRVYRNDTGVYSEAIVLDGAFHGTAAWVDYDTDGDLDIFSSGAERVSGEVRGTVLRNDGGVFSPAERFGGGLFGDAAIADYDDDGDVDFHIFGNFTNAGLFARQYRNEIATTNTPPTAPSAALAIPTAGAVTLTWSSSTDDQTPAAGLTYNVRVGITPGGNEILPAMSNPTTARRLITARGNVDHNLSWSLKNLAPRTYYWAVQAVDPAGNTSPFTTELSFVIP